ncbi:MAG: cytochrome c biogenesis protein ResB [Candidatus Aminicenantes bacterium]|nr:MAG: cytochrome c biogenesis protein ResB [Candidatus Aminicenantes bacterium]
MTIFWRGASSGRLALVLVGVLILFSLAGAVLPQEGLYAPGDIARWQEQHPIITALMKPVGFFRVFHSIPFLVTIFLLAINTLTCTVVRFFKEGAISAFKGPKALRNIGFIILHLSLIALFIGGAWSSAVRMDGYIILTEGQSFREEHNNYLRIVEGPFRPEYHREFVVRLDKVKVTYQNKNYLIDMTSNLEFQMNKNNKDKVTKAVIKVNQPFTFEGVNFTQDQVGFSPRLVIRDRLTGRLLVNSYVALKTFRYGQEREYRDFLPLPFFKQQVIVTLYPSYIRVDGQVKKSGEEPENPILLVEMEDDTGQKVLQDEISLGGSITLGKYSLGFVDLRRWSSFRVVEDPGYAVVWIALLVGLGGFILRYLPELRGWFKEERKPGS